MVMNFFVKHKWKIVFFVLLVFVLLVSVYFQEYISIEGIKENREEFKGFVDENYFLAVFVFFLLNIVFVNSPLPLAAVVKLLGGFLFGVVFGFFYNVLATTIGCYAGFLVSRYAFNNSFHKMYGSHLKKVEKEIEENGFFYFLTVRVVLVIPYFLINIIAGLSRISNIKYLGSTFLGVLVPSFIYANAGSKIDALESAKDIFSFDIILALVLVAGLSFLPPFIKKLLRKNN